MRKNQILLSYEAKNHTRRRFLFICLYAFTLFFVINFSITYFIFPARQASVSMIPDISENSLVMLSPLAKKIERGNVVMLYPKKRENLSKIQKLVNLTVRFFTAQQISLYEKNNFPGTNYQLRRIVGLPGDSIYMRDYVLYVKPAGTKHYLTEFEITDKPYNVTFFTAPPDWDSYIGVKGSFDEIVLADDEYFVLGDNRKSSDDSRLYGMVKKADIRAKALFCYFPFDKIKFL